MDRAPFLAMQRFLLYCSIALIQQPFNLHIDNVQLLDSNIEFFAGGGLWVGGEEGQDGRGGDQVSQMELLFLVAAFRSGKMEQKGWLAIAKLEPLTLSISLFYHYKVQS